MAKIHLWQGVWIDDQTLEQKLTDESILQETFLKNVDLQLLLKTATLYSAELHAKTGAYAILAKTLQESGLSVNEASLTLTELANFLDRENLETKLRRELQSTEPFLPKRISFTENLFEAWTPLGLLVHIAPGNSPTVAPLSALEGLLSGNINFLKTSSDDTLFAQHFLDGLFQLDPTNTLKDFVIVARFSSRKKEWLQRIFSLADGIAAWGGEESLAEIRKAAPSGARVIDWGHKISFIYLTKSAAQQNEVLEKIAEECCLMEQQACSSPQCIYLEEASWQELEDFGERFAKIFDRVSKKIPRLEAALEQEAEITLTTELLREEACFGQARVIEGANKEWRILIDSRPALTASPLFRSIWVKSLKRAEIVPTLRPMRQYLQTVGLACDLRDLSELSKLLLKAGSVRIRQIGEMPGSYSGEAHDGVYALPRYCKRISLQLGSNTQRISSFADLKENEPPLWAKKPKIMTKADFQKTAIDTEFAELYFKSGGSTGDPKLSVFTYNDYHEQMKIGAEGLFAAGLEPKKDRSINLFFSGSLYGGFLSIFSVLEILQAVQFPMSAVTDLALVADTIVKNKINVLLGMPSYIIQLFEQQREKLLAYSGVQKIFYGGEHFNEVQRQYLAKEFGVELIRSVGYGSVDTGPLAYQCRFCEGGIHHVHSRLQFLEILEQDKDQAVMDETIGRLVFTSKQRKGQALDRYDLGDLGHWLLDPCPCGRPAPRFRLLGRSGDVFRIGSMFFNYEKFCTILAESLQYTGALQIYLQQDGLNEKITVQLTEENHLSPTDIREALVSAYKDLREAVVEDKVLGLEVVKIAASDMPRAKGSGKLLRIIDERKR